METKVMAQKPKPQSIDDRPTVWIAHDRGGYDFSKAEKYGVIKKLFDGEFNPFDLRTAMTQAREKLSKSGPNDWIVVVGNGVAAVLATAVYEEMWHRIPLLVFHAGRRDYVRREIFTGGNGHDQSEYVSDSDPA